MQIFNKKRGQKGFTLIELLVVIAIIGILAGIVLVSLGSARARAQDARIGADMSQIRTAAELYYVGNNNVYSGLACTITDPAVDDLCADIDTQNGAGAAPTFSASATTYCAYAPLASSGKWWCVSQTQGVSKETATNPSGVGFCTATTYLCP